MLIRSLGPAPGRLPLAAWVTMRSSCGRPPLAMLHNRISGTQRYFATPPLSSPNSTSAGSPSAPATTARTRTSRRARSEEDLDPNIIQFDQKSRGPLYFGIGASAFILLGSTLLFHWATSIYPKRSIPDAAVFHRADESTTVTNWSATHAVTLPSSSVHYPSNLDELEKIVADSHFEHRFIRPVGSALSPNGIGLGPYGMINLALMDKILDIDREQGTVRVQAGARIEQVVEALRPYGLTLPNYASIREQQVAGFTQVGAHGTGATIPPVDDFVVGMKIVTPGKGTLDLKMSTGDLRDDGSANSIKDTASAAAVPDRWWGGSSYGFTDPELLRLARLSLGTLGVVAELTLKVVPAHKLVEETRVYSIDQVKRNHSSWLYSNQHLRYMWIPHTDKVVVVKSNPLNPLDHHQADLGHESSPLEERLAGIRRLYRQLSSELPGKLPRLTEDMGYTALRDAMYMADPLNVELVRRVNEAAAEYWTRSEGTRTDWSDQILGFDCGGQQWVSEVAFPVTHSSLSAWSSQYYADLGYMDRLLQIIRDEKLPAHEPIEQRWTKSSGSPLSPAARDLGSVYAWVGIIMYLPDARDDRETESLRHTIQGAFMEYQTRCSQALWDRYGAQEHWAKIEADMSIWTGSHERIQRRFGAVLGKLKKVKQELDPRGILGEPKVNELLGL
ncbi:uncharacterized protein BJ171DRAFT_115796 [Polychytrium aggregatum]|uniref:uncharacterized protein n=1 Tax=Polychytrium aggregatum TaxID=110093 RepID=UPI0022FDE144|nr:uncharacterized protein BJ171DRAFT_115796 [Polychytrium aggregatum]KAI9209336.1 hypothetical protein BJ171DRAFT_115796 [Polychytrium aggregatum]